MKAITNFWKTKCELNLSKLSNNLLLINQYFHILQEKSIVTAHLIATTISWYILFSYVRVNSTNMHIKELFDKGEINSQEAQSC